MILQAYRFALDPTQARALALASHCGAARSRLVIADRWYPSSKTCSACGAVKAKLALADREYQCDPCGAVSTVI